MRPRLWTALGAILLFAGRAAGQELRAEPLTQGPPADALAPEIAGQIAAQGVKVSRGGQAVADFAGATVSMDPGGFTIRVVLGDDAELHGLLAALSREGYALVDVRREPTAAPGEG